MSKEFKEFWKDIGKLPATAEQLRRVRNLMLGKLDTYYGGGMLPDTHQYERIRRLSDLELEREFKEIFHISSTNYYFD